MHSSPSHYQQLQPEERVTIASLTQQNHSVRAIVNRPGFRGGRLV